MKKKPKHGGRRPGAGRPVTTGSSATPEVRFRLGLADYTVAARLARECGVTVGTLARDAFLAALDKEQGPHA